MKAVLIALLACAAALDQDPAGRAPTFGAKTGFVPLCDMSEKDRYKEEDGGLYGQGKNDPPAAQAERARIESSKIRALDSEGMPSDNGKIVLLSIGMSNTTQEYSRFIQISGVRRGGPLVLVDGAQGGQAAIQWDTAQSRPWGEVENRLKAAGVTSAQVQVVWIKQALIQQGQHGAFPAHAKRLQEELCRTVQLAKSKYPNLRLAYLSSRIYAGYAKTQLNPEPYAYEGAFSVRWLIQEQMKGSEALNSEDSKGPVRAPVLLWGPYLWGDGETSRACDSLVWKESDFGKDGTHPSESGRDKVAQMLLKFFKNDPSSKAWFNP